MSQSMAGRKKVRDVQFITEENGCFQSRVTQKALTLTCGLTGEKM